MAPPNDVSCTVSPPLPDELEQQVSMLEFLTTDLDLCLRSDAVDMDSTPSSETTTLSGRQDSLSSSRTSLCSSTTSHCGSQHSATAKPTKRVRFEESASWTFFDDNEGMPTRPNLRKRPSFMTRSLDRILTRHNTADADVGVPPAALSAMTDNLRQLQRRNSSIDIADLATKTTSRYSTPGRRGSLVLTVQQPLRQSAGRRYSNAQTPARAPAVPAPKGDWGDLLGPPKTHPLAV